MQGKHTIKRRATMMTIELSLADRMMRGSDYPHTDGIWLESSG